MLAIDTSNNVKICKVSYCEVTMVSVTSYKYPTERGNDNSHFQSQTQSQGQGLSQSLRDSIEGNIEAFDAMEQSGLLDNCRT
ncbi:hypothetical protein F3D14_27230, partial [Bacteroides ovatus]